MVRTQIRLTEKQIKALKKLAASRQVSLSELIRLGVDVVLQAHGMMNIEDNKKRVLSLSGRYRSGKSNIAKEHDQYLAEALKI